MVSFFYLCANSAAPIPSVVLMPIPLYGAKANNVFQISANGSAKPTLSVISPINAGIHVPFSLNLVEYRV